MAEKWFNQLKLILSNQPTPLYFAPRPGLMDKDINNVLNLYYHTRRFGGSKVSVLNDEVTQNIKSIVNKNKKKIRDKKLKDLGIL